MSTTTTMRVRRNSIRLKAGVTRIVHVHAKTIAKNLAERSEAPMVVVRTKRNLRREMFFREVKINGAGTLAPHFDEPLPGTDGRGVCYVVTDAELICYVD